MDSGRRFLLFFLISKMNGFLYLCLLHFKKKMEQEDFNIREHQLTSRERDFENALRPLSFEDFSGQDKVVENLRIFVKAARLRGEALDHVLLHGPPGLGKTTLSNIIANELGVGFKVTSGPVLDKPGDLAGVLTSLEPNDVLFIDEIHRLSPVVEEYLYSAMEDYRWEYGDAKALTEELHSAFSVTNAWLWRIESDLGTVSEEQYLLYNAVSTTYDSYTALVDQLEEAVAAGQDTKAAQLYYNKIVPCGGYLRQYTQQLLNTAITDAQGGLTPPCRPSATG